MSFFLGNDISNLSPMEVNPEKVKIAEIQFEAMATTFNTLMSTCHKKCIPPFYGENDLNKGEQSCIDRCVSKFVQANLAVGQNLQSKQFGPHESMPAYVKVKTILEESSK